MGDFWRMSQAITNWFSSSTKKPTRAKTRKRKRSKSEHGEEGKDEDGDDCMNRQNESIPCNERSKKRRKLSNKQSAKRKTSNTMNTITSFLTSKSANTATPKQNETECELEGNENEKEEALTDNVTVSRFGRKRKKINYNLGSYWGWNEETDSKQTDENDEEYHVESDEQQTK